MAINRMTKTALEALKETCQKIIDGGTATRVLVKEFLECICYIIDDDDVQKGAGSMAPGLNMAKWAIRKWLNKSN